MITVLLIIIYFATYKCTNYLYYYYLLLYEIGRLDDQHQCFVLVRLLLYRR